MEVAVYPVLEKKMGPKKALKQFNVPRSTLHLMVRKCQNNNIDPSEAVKSKLGKFSVLGENIDRIHTKNGRSVLYFNQKRFV